MVILSEWIPNTIPQFLVYLGLVIFIVVLFFLFAPYRYRRSVGLVHGVSFAGVGLVLYASAYLFKIYLAPYDTAASDITPVVAVEPALSQFDGGIDRVKPADSTNVAASLKPEWIMMRARAQLHKRACPATHCRSLAIIPKGTVIEVDKHALDDNWYPLRERGYVAALWLEREEAKRD